MADNTGGGGTAGPNDIDIKNATRLNEVFLEIQDTLTSVGSSLKTSLEAQIRLTAAAGDFDEAAEKAAKKTLTSLTAELTRGTRAVDKTRELVNKVNEGSVTSKKIQEKINETRSRQTSIQNTLLLLEKQGVEITARHEEIVQEVLDDLERQIQIEDKLLDRAKKREKEWLNKFTEEYVNASVDSKNLKKNLHNTEELKKDCYARNNARNRCILTLQRAQGKIEYTEENTKILGENPEEMLNKEMDSQTRHYYDEYNVLSEPSTEKILRRRKEQK